MTELDKTRVNQLKPGDEILVRRDGDALRVATARTGADVAMVTSAPTTVAAPQEGKRSGYRIVTSLGVVDFVARAAKVALADDTDRTRQARRDADRESAAADSQGTLDGLVMTGADRAAAVKPKAPPARKPPVAAAKPKPPKPPVKPRVQLSAVMVENYRAQARASTTDRARAYWNAKADGTR
jgi:hypothetical protein